MKSAESWAIGNTMDKRWLAILIILIMAICCGYYVVSSSNSVGNAIADLNKSTVTLPYGFSVGKTTPDSVELIKRNHSEKIFLKDLGKEDKALAEFENEIKTLSKSNETSVTGNLTNNTDNIKVYTIYYQYIKDDNILNESISSVYTYNHTYLVKLTGFPDDNTMNEYLNSIIDTIRPDYKKSQR